jgi:hypothetical protein
MSAPVITRQPKAQQVTPGSNVTFAVKATGATSYQWKKDGVNVSGSQYSGGTSATLVISDVVEDDAGLYKCAVTNGDGTTNSDSVNLAVYSVSFDPMPASSEPAIPPDAYPNSGSGSPEGVRLGKRGDYYWDYSNNNLYVKDSAGWGDTGWVIQVGSGGGSAQLVTYTSGTPADPSDTSSPALAYDPTGALPTLGWNTSTLTWN